MVIVQFRIDVQNELHFDVDYDILKREDANQLEMDIAQKVEVIFAQTFLRAAKKAGLNVKQDKIVGA